MKRLLALLLALLLFAALTACAAKAPDSAESIVETVTETITETANGFSESDVVSSTDNVTIDGVFVDDSYAASDGSPLKPVYVFFTATATEKNFEYCSTGIQITFNGNNTYDAEMLHPKLKLQEYFYENSIETLYMGSSQKILATFLVAGGDFAPDRRITFWNWLDSVPFDGIQLSTNDIQHFNCADEILKAIEPKAYQEELEKHEPADDETVKKIKEDMNGYYWKDTIWSDTVSGIEYKVEFSAENNFEVTSTLKGFSLSNKGTYDICKGYIICTYTEADIDKPIEIPWSYNESGDLLLDLYAAFG